MILGVLKVVVGVCVVYKIYKKLEEQMLKDEEYLMRISDQDSEFIMKTIDEARKHMRDKEYDLATEYFYYAHKVLGCDWGSIVCRIDSEEVLKLLHMKKSP